MRRFFLLAGLAVASAMPAAAGTYLYATAASQSRVDGFQIYADGSLSADPVVQRYTKGVRPRRLVKRGCTLYVVESNRVEVWRAGAGGALERIGATRSSKKMQARDVALSTDGRMLYVPFRKDNLIAAYPLGADGVPNADPIVEDGVTAGGPTSCTYGPPAAGWEDVGFANGKLYVNVSSKNDLFVYGTDALGRIVGTPEISQDMNGDGDTTDNGETFCPFYATDLAEPQACPQPDVDRPTDTCPLSRRTHLSAPIGLVVDGTTLVTGPRFQDRLQGFTLDPNGNFQPFGVDPAQPTKKEKKQERKMRKKNRTNVTLRYLGLTMFKPPTGAAIIFAATFKGRIDDFRLNDDGTLPRPTTSRSQKNVVTTPTRTAVLPGDGTRNAVLYVAAGEIDRVQAYRLNDGGIIPADTGPFSQTNELKGSFPNDVVVINTDTCE